MPGDDRVARDVYRFRILFMHANTYDVGVPRTTMVRHPEEAILSTPMPSGPE